MVKILGIDFGTTNIRMAVMSGGNTTVIPNAEGMLITPSIVGFTKSGELLIGDSAKQLAITNSLKTVYSIKRLVGRKYDEVQREINNFGCNVIRAANGDAAIEVDVDGKSKQLSLHEILSMILGKIRADAKLRLGEEISNAVITVPAYFNGSQRQAIIDAGRIAGLKVDRLINETTAAALAYGVENNKNCKVAVLNFGGGAFEISILDIGDDVYEVLSNNNDAQLTGNNIDKILTNYLTDEFKKNEGVDLRNDSVAYQYLKDATEKAKCDLSLRLETTISLPFITADASGSKKLHMTLTRDNLESLCEHLFGCLRESCCKALEEAKLRYTDLDEVLLVGGGARIPKVQQIVKDIFGKEPKKNFNTDEAMAIGAGIQGGILSGEGFRNCLTLDVISLSLGVETMGGVMTKIIERNTTIPASKKEIFSTSVDNQTSVDIHVLQGERELVKDNRTLGRFQVTGIPLKPRGVPQIEVTFDIDASGIPHMSAQDLSTGKKSVMLGSGYGLSETEIKRIQIVTNKFIENYRRSRQIPCLGSGGHHNIDQEVTSQMADITPTQKYNFNQIKEPHIQDSRFPEECSRPVESRILKEQYELLSEVGRGGFGAVYRARDVHLDQFVAIKELMLENPVLLKEEAKVLSGLRHKNIVGFRQFFPEGDSWYLVMDYVEGGSLARMICHQALYEGAKEQILQQMLSIITQTAEGLSCAHEYGVIHQDVKPDNVMVTPDGLAKVSDFGLAKARPQTRGIATQSERRNILVSMNGMTQAYCSPEQAAGDKLTKKTDIWSWGLLVMEMFIGEVTWMHGTAAPQVLKQYKEKGIRDKNIPEMPRHLTVLLERCFEKEPKTRPDMKEIIRILAGSQSGARGNWLSRIFK